MKCKICSSETKEIHSAKVLNKYDVKYFQCCRCSFVQTQEPYWLDEAYSDSISISDTGIMDRNTMLSKVTTSILSLSLNKKQKFLDYGGGYGIFTRMMRDKGFDFFWYDKYSKNMIARGFEGSFDLKYEAVTSFENFEHFEEPLKEIEKIFSITDFVLFSTNLVSDPAPSTEEWWYYCLEHGQHISFFSKKSLQYIADKYGYNFITNGVNIHIFSKKKISNNIFTLEKLIRKLHLDGYLEMESKILKDMNNMIRLMEKR